MSRLNSLPTTRYSHVAMGLHWGLGALIVAVFVGGLYMTGLPFSPLRLKLYNWHKWAGMVILALSVLRLVWRITHPVPALPDALRQNMPLWQQWAHHGTHAGLYGLFFLVPLLGWMYSSAAGFPIMFLGVLPLPDLVSADKALAELIKPWHRLAAYGLAGLVVLHVAAALKHHWIDRDGLIHRMWPART